MDASTYTAYLPVATPNFSAVPPSIVRKVGGDGPVTNIGTSNITCNIGAAPLADNGVSRSGPVTAGSVVSFHWSPGWPHSGPLVTWMARCANDDCGTFTGSAGNVWFKIDQSGYNTTTSLWASYYIYSTQTWNVTVPKCLADGEYLIRHETIALSDCGTKGRCQFYPSCTQVTVRGGGGYVMPLSALSALPGAYTADNVLWDTNTQLPQEYKIPGPAVFTCPT